jgi:hypothetical protein
MGQSSPTHNSLLICLFTSSSMPRDKIFCLFVFLVGFVASANFLIFFLGEVVLDFLFVLSRLLVFELRCCMYQKLNMGD